MKYTVFRFVKIALVILLVLAIGLIEIRFNASPGGWDFCIAPVGMCPEMPRFGVLLQHTGK